MALGDTNEWVRSSACETLVKMGEKAATNEIINALMMALGDTNEWVRSSACEALGKMGEKAATNEVMEILLNAYFDKKFEGTYTAREAIIKILTSLPDLSNLKHDAMSRLSEFFNQLE
jgi:HEAT repeat protein